MDVYPIDWRALAVKNERKLMWLTALVRDQATRYAQAGRLEDAENLEALLAQALEESAE